MKFAHSLGFVHYNRMLETVSARELQEVFMTFEIEAEQKEKKQKRIEEIKTRRQLNKKMIEQANDGTT